MNSLGAKLAGVVAMVVVAVLMAWPASATTPLGTKVENVAEVTIGHPSGDYQRQTNAAVFEVVAVPTPSQIDFFRHAPMAPEARQVSLNGTDFSPIGNDHGAEFEPVGPASLFGGNRLDLSEPVSLVAAETYLAGEPLFLRVIDTGQNVDPGRIETVVITLRSDGGDEVCLRLYESGPDTGHFYGFVQSSRKPSQVNDTRLTAPKGSELTASYEDRFDETEVSVDTALVDPFGRVFDSITGELVDGARVTIVDADTGQPAEVFGIDGVSAYPATVRTGDNVADESGRLYELDTGEFLFPLMRPGDYRLRVEPPQGHVFPSGFEASAFEDLDNAPFEIIGGSYGRDFTVTGSGPLNLDVPLDTTRGLSVTKTSGVATAAVGDFVSYAITVDNVNDAPMPVILRDTLPPGFRYSQGSAQLGDEALADPQIATQGRTLSFDAGRLAAGESLTLSYVAAVGAGVGTGTAINRVQAVSPVGRALSNRAEADVEIREDLLRSELTLVGRVAEDACDAEADWARPLRKGKGVAGVRLYLETGEYVVTDKDGLFHFQGVDATTHVLQLDTASLPQGYEPMVCEENSRYAGSAISKFVDASGGTIWRANFYLKRTGEIEEAAKKAQFNDRKAYRNYDKAWLDTQTPQVQWVYPDASRTPSQQSVNLGIKTPANANVELKLNGAAVPALNRRSGITSSDRSSQLHRWGGVDIASGRNVFEAIITGPQGQRKTLRREIWFVTQAQRARLVSDQSSLVADGRTNPVIALRLEDSQGHALHAGRIVDVSVGAPYELAREERFEEGSGVTGRVEAAGVEVDPNGIARVRLEPTLATGRVRLQVPLAGGRTEEVTAYLRPEKRDWILVGLAEGTLGAQGLNGEAGGLVEADDLIRDGRAALFAKGMVKGDWLLTLAIDTAKRRGRDDDALFETIDPEAYYTLYGDRTLQQHDAAGQFPLFVKLEKDTAQILFGDFNTDLNDTRLGRYSRRLSGLRVVQEGERVSATGFASETDQGFVKDEIAADGTSGPYRLSVTPVVRNSEVITVETRDRIRPDRVIATRTLKRFIDYEIDYTTGELLFRAPVNATDSEFNDNVIVVDYESIGSGARELTYGGRAAVHTSDRRFEAGVSHVHEAGAGSARGGDSEVTTLDASAQITERTELRAEVAQSRRDGEAETEGGRDAEAYLVEAEHRSETLSVSAYVRSEETGFGVGQTGSNTQGFRRYGAEATGTVSDRVDPETGSRTTRTISGQAYREEVTDTGDSRTVGEVSLNQSGQLANLSAGLRSIQEDIAGTPRQSLLGTASLSRTFQKLGLTVSAAQQQPLGGDNADEATLFPRRTILSADKQVTERAVLNLRHEITDGETASGSNTIAGITLMPWTGSTVEAGVNALTQDGARRLAATIGVDQELRFGERWSASLGAANRSRVDGSDAAQDPFGDDAVSPLADGVRSPLTRDESFTSAYAGLGYSGPKAVGSGRVEVRDAVSTQRYAGTVAAAREATERLSYAGALRYQVEAFDAAAKRRNLDVRLGLAWRPRGEGPIVFDRLDFRREEVLGRSETWKLVNNLGVNTMLGDSTQLAGYWGVKYTESELAGFQAKGWTHLLGGEVRHDITPKLDLGLQAMALHTSATGTREFAVGPSVGISPKDNIWISLGYNFTGFRDRDFEAAAYSRHGVYIRLRVKFDQTGLKGLLDRVSPSPALPSAENTASPETP